MQRRVPKHYRCIKAALICSSSQLNIRDSNGTLIIVPTWPLPEKIKDGTQLTIDYAKVLQKPHLIIRLDKTEKALHTFKAWIVEHNIKVLNIAGPRESSCSVINSEASKLFLKLFAA
ncbi:MAG: hypothetical protein H0U73_06320 [Tatlockia sp.]|nr:hypothetical protein [Tatlockia sp.]